MDPSFVKIPSNKQLPSTKVENIEKEIQEAEESEDIIAIEEDSVHRVSQQLSSKKDDQ